AREYPFLDTPDNPVKTIRMYRVAHSIMTPSDMAKGRSPVEKSLFWPFFLGDYDVKGNLKNPDDPFLYWVLPIVPRDINAIYRKGPVDYINTLEVHAGSVPPELQEPKNP